MGRTLGHGPAGLYAFFALERRNASTRTYRLDYRASVAQWHAERRARRPKAAKLAGNDRLRHYVQQRLAGTVCDADGHRALGPPGQRWNGKNKAPSW
jgi:hypothetical protein